LTQPAGSSAHIQAHQLTRFIYSTRPSGPITRAHTEPNPVDRPSRLATLDHLLTLSRRYRPNPPSRSLLLGQPGGQVDSQHWIICSQPCPGDTDLSRSLLLGQAGSTPGRNKYELTRALQCRRNNATHYPPDKEKHKANPNARSPWVTTHRAPPPLSPLPPLPPARISTFCYCIRQTRQRKSYTGVVCCGVLPYPCRHDWSMFFSGCAGYVNKPIGQLVCNSQSV